MIGMHIIKEKYSVIGGGLSGISKLFPRGSNIQTETPEASGRWIGEVVAAWVAKGESSAHSPGGSV